MHAQWIVMKFGGTSVAGRPQWETIAALARQRQAEGWRVLLVCSAVAGVTNRLTALADDPAADTGLQELIEVHRSLGRELGVEERRWLARATTLLRECLDGLRKEPGPPARAVLLAAGEWLSTQIGSLFLRDQGIDATWVDAREALETLPEPDLSPVRQWLSADCAAGSDAALQALWSGLGPVLITQGFTARSADGRTALLGRGGSDTSAALLAGRLQSQRLEIWTDVPGLFSADPRLIPEARLLKEVDYAEALEMAGKSPFDVILTDLRMPTVGGREFYEPLAASDPAAASRVVFATGDTVGDDALRFLEASGRPFLRKPFTLAELRTALARTARA